MFKSKVPYIFGKNNQFFVHSAYSQFCLQYKTIQRFVKHGTHSISSSRTGILRWLGRGSVQNVTRTRKWGGSHYTPPSHLSFTFFLNATHPWPSLMASLTLPYTFFSHSSLTTLFMYSNSPSSTKHHSFPTFLYHSLILPLMCLFFPTFPAQTTTLFQPSNFTHPFLSSLPIPHTIPFLPLPLPLVPIMK